MKDKYSIATVCHLTNCSLSLNLGFMYVRFTQPPGDLFDWYEEYMQDEEEIDVKAGGGQVRFIIAKNRRSIQIINTNIYPFQSTDCHNRSFAVPIPDQIGLVFNSISTNSGAHTKAN